MQIDSICDESMCPWMIISTRNNYDCHPKSSTPDSFWEDGLPGSLRAWQGEPGRISESLSDTGTEVWEPGTVPGFPAEKKHCSASSFYVSENLHTKKGTHLYLFRKVPELQV